MRWSLQDAKNGFSALVEAARRDGPQTVTKRGLPAVVVVAADEFDRLRRLDARPRESFVEFLLAGPKSDAGLVPSGPNSGGPNPSGPGRSGGAGSGPSDAGRDSGDR